MNDPCGGLVLAGSPGVLPLSGGHFGIGLRSSTHRVMDKYIAEISALFLLGLGGTKIPQWASARRGSVDSSPGICEGRSRRARTSTSPLHFAAAFSHVDPSSEMYVMLADAPSLLR